jgi:hypothetical protein
MTNKCKTCGYDEGPRCFAEAMKYDVEHWCKCEKSVKDFSKAIDKSGLRGYKFEKKQGCAKLERWEDDEFIITINNKPIGGTVTKGQGESLLVWLNQSGLRDILCPECDHSPTNLPSRQGNLGKEQVPSDTETGDGRSSPLIGMANNPEPGSLKDICECEHIEDRHAKFIGECFGCVCKKFKAREK